MTPWMKPEEIELIKNYLFTADKTVLEWGSGGSTVAFSPFSKLWYSIEHNSQWFEKVKKETEDLKNVRLHYVPPEIISPKRPSKYEDWESYIEFPRILNKKFDVILIDGRARPECAIEAKRHIKKDGVVIIHDFYDKYRPHYKIVLEHYDIVDQITTRPGLVVLKKKA